MELIQHDLFLTYRATLLFHQPILNALAMIKMSAFEDSNILSLIDIIVTDTTYFLGEPIFLVIQDTALDLIIELWRIILGFGQKCKLNLI